MRSARFALAFLLPLAGCRVQVDEHHRPAAPVGSSKGSPASYVSSPLPATRPGGSVAVAGELEVTVWRLDREAAGEYLGPRARHTMERPIVLDVSLRARSGEIPLPTDWIRVRRGNFGAAPLEPNEVLNLASLPSTIDSGTLFRSGAASPVDIVLAVVSMAPLIDAYGAADYRAAAADVRAKATIPASIGTEPVRRIVVFPPLANPNLELDAPELVFRTGTSGDSPAARVALPPLPRS